MELILWRYVLEKIISIIIPVYNAEKYIGRCLDSILKQTYTKLEIILVNDGSTDKSGEICDEYAEIDNRIHVIHKKNGGVSAARNDGICISTGEFIGFVDADDWCEPTMYEELMGAVLSENADVARCNFYVNYNRTQKIFVSKGSDKQVVSGKQAISNAIDRDSGVGFGEVIWNSIFNKNLVKQPDVIKFDTNMIMGEDTDWLFRVLMRSKSVVLVANPCYNYNKANEKSATHTVNYEKRLFSLERKLQYLKDNQFSSDDINSMYRRKQDVLFFIDINNYLSGKENDTEVIDSCSIFKDVIKGRKLNIVTIKLTIVIIMIKLRISSHIINNVWNKHIAR